MPCTAMIRLILNSTEYLAPELLNKIATAIYTAARQVIEEEGKGNLIGGAVNAMAFQGTLSGMGMIEGEELPFPPLAAMFDPSQLEKDEYGATKGCDCPGCQSMRAKAPRFGLGDLICLN